MSSDRLTGEFLNGKPFVKLLNWATGLTKEGGRSVFLGIELMLQGNRVCPATSGATNWMSPAFNPDTNLFNVVAQEGCGISYKSNTFRPGGFPFYGDRLCGSPEEPWQMYARALDPATGTLRWEYRQINSRRYGAGHLSTAGGLILAGDDQAKLTVLDAATGKALWHFNSGTRISASPMTFSVNGRHEYRSGGRSKHRGVQLGRPVKTRLVLFSFQVQLV